ncbi:MAG: type II toxin-antitoxin system RelE/ParE family toxin [Thermoleophilaceae bacterium]
MADLRLTRRARNDLEALPGKVRGAVLDTLGGIQVHPQAAGKPLVGRLRGLWSTRVGSYRILYTIDDSGGIVRAIRHRAVAYGRRRRS